MKQLVAVLFLIAYSLTSFGASLSGDTCSDKHQSSCHPTTAPCGITVAAALNCCDNHPQACTFKADENKIESISYQEIAVHYQIPPSILYNRQGYSPTNYLPANTDVPLTVYKIRLHLYQRVLLI